MVVGHDVAVRTDDDAGSAAALLAGLAEAVTVPEAEEEFEGVDGAGLALNGHLHINDGLHGRLSGIGEVRIIRVCQIDSAIFHGVAGNVRHHGGGLGSRLRSARLRSAGLHHAKCGETAGQNR